VISETDTTAKAPIRNQPAVVVDLGSKDKKAVKLLRKGKGSLLHEVNQVINELRAAGALTGPAQPVVVIVKEKEDETTLPLFGLFGS
jgi:Family of unknown function (DUF6200)